MLPAEHHIKVAKSLTSRFGSRARRRAQLIRSLKRVRHYARPVRGGTKSKSKFGKEAPVISLPALKAQRLLHPSFLEDDSPYYPISVSVAKSDSKRGLVFGWANVALNPDGTELVDHQDHSIPVDDLEETAYRFTLNYRETGVQHRGSAVGQLVESLIVTQDKIDKADFPSSMLGKWWVGFRVPAEIQAKVDSGQLNMFSIQGRARLEPKLEPSTIVP